MADGGFLATAIAALFLGLVPAGLICVGIVRLIGKRRFARRAHLATGIVVALESEVAGATGSPEDELGKFGRPAWRPEFRYTDATGDERTAKTARATVAFNFPVGSEQVIMIDPDHPDVADIPGAGFYAMPILLIAGGVVIGILGLWSFGVF